MIERNAEQVCSFAQSFVRTQSSGLGVISPGGVIVGTDQAPAFIRISGLNTSREWTMAKVSDPGGHDIDADEPMFRIQATDQELLPIQASEQGCGGSRPRPPMYAPIQPPEWHGLPARA